MEKYAIIVDEELGTVNVAMGTNNKYYRSIGMTLMDVEQSEVDYQWYLAEKCPHLSENELLKRNSQEEIEILKKQLLETDYKAIKYAEGEISEEDYAPIKAERRSYRVRINELQESIKEMENN